MQTFIVVAALLAVCACSAIPPASDGAIEVDYEAIPTIPGDNSHYVEGKSRYIWMTDAEGEPILIDLHMPVDEAVTRNGARNHYWLYTRLNPSSPQILVPFVDQTVWTSNFFGFRPLRVIVHGYFNTPNSDFVRQTTTALLDTDDVNVVVVDWSGVANDMNYNNVVDAVGPVGKAIGDFLVWLVNTSFSTWNDVHLIGHGIGAHIVGNAGSQANKRPGRITGLDPAGPSFRGNPVALNSSCANYVEAIHTDGNILGIFERVANADFYPNGGRNPQPECRVSACSHERAWELFVSSIRTNHFKGQQCTNISQAVMIMCSGNELKMGNDISSKRGSGIFGLRTNGTFPY